MNKSKARRRPAMIFDEFSMLWGDEFARAIAARRAELGMTPRDVARKIGMSEEQIMELEQGKRDALSARSLLALAGALEMDAAALRELAAKRPPSLAFPAAATRLGKSMVVTQDARQDGGAPAFVLDPKGAAAECGPIIRFDPSRHPAARWNPFAALCVFGNTVRERRERLRFTREQVSEHTGIDTATLQGLEDGTVDPGSTRWILALAGALDIDAAELRALAEQQTSDAYKIAKILQDPKNL